MSHEYVLKPFTPEIRLNIELDQDLIGGLVVRIGDDIIDGSVSGRLTEAAQHASH